MEFDVDLETHLKIMEATKDEPTTGLIVHAAGPAAAGVVSLDLWESKEDADRYFAQQLMPALQRLGIEGGPPVSFQELDLPVVLRG